MVDNTQASKPVLAVDLDDTLGGFIPALIKYHNEAFQTSLTMGCFHSYDFWEVWGGTREEADAKMKSFFVSPFFLEGIKPLPGVRRVLQQLSNEFELQIVTSRQHFLEEATIQWLNSNFPGVFSQVHFGNHYGTSGAKRSKPEMCKDINAVALIDDSLRYATHMAEESIPCVLYGDYAWNGGLRERREEDGGDGGGQEALPPGVARAAHWRAVPRALRALGVRGGGPPTLRVRAGGDGGGRWAGKKAVASAQRLLSREPQVEMAAVGAAVATAVDAAQLLVRQGVAEITGIDTSLIDVQTGRKSCLKIQLTRTEQYVDYLERVKEHKETGDFGGGGGEDVDFEYNDDI